MEILDWSGSSEIKELHCGQKSVTVQCQSMTCYWLFVCPDGYGAFEDLN